VGALESESSAVVALPRDFPAHRLEGHIGFDSDMELVDYDPGWRSAVLPGLRDGSPTTYR
jgi:hypothetical protein